MGDVVVCRGCKKFFDFLPRGLCPDCLDVRDEQFKRVRDFIYTSPSATIQQVSEATGVGTSTIRELIKDGELGWAPSDMAALAQSMTCEICGGVSDAGKQCSSCRSRLVGGLTKVDDDVAREHEKHNTRAYTTKDAQGETQRRMWRRS